MGNKYLIVSGVTNVNIIKKRQLQVDVILRVKKYEFDTKYSRRSLQTPTTSRLQHQRDLQLQVISSFVSEKDVFAVLPTGYGKSLLFMSRRFCDKYERI